MFFLPQLLSDKKLSYLVLKLFHFNLKKNKYRYAIVNNIIDADFDIPITDILIKQFINFLLII